MEMPIMLRLREDEDSTQFIYTPVSTITLISNDDNIIKSIGTIDGTEVYYIESTTNDLIEIRSLNCKSYEEFVIALELYNLLHGMNINANNWSKLEQNQMKKIRKLEQENIELKNKLNQLKKIINIKDE